MTNEKRIEYIEGVYECYLGWRLPEDLNITMDDVSHVWIKYGNCEIHLKNGDIIKPDACGDMNDFKWPEKIKIMNDDYDQLNEEEE